MRRIRYQVAASLDGYIAGPKGEADWIITDPEIDFRAIFAKFDTLLIGRRTFEAMIRDGKADVPGMKTFVFSQSLRQIDYPNVTIVAEKSKEAVTSIRARSGKDIWLFGGGLLFRSFLEFGLVDGVEVAIIPVLLGGGLPLLPQPASLAKLKLVKHKIYQKTGTVLLEYTPL